MPRAQELMSAMTLQQKMRWLDGSTVRPAGDRTSIRQVDYTEGLQSGHSWYDAQGIAPLFPFGYGLSYTTFTADHLQATPATVQDSKPIRVRFRLTNTGQRAGTQVEQVYLTLPASSGEPPKRLVGWARVSLDPSQSQNVEVDIDPASAGHPLSYYDSGSQSWVTPSGMFTVSLGSSVDNIDQTDTITVHPSGSANNGQ